MKRPTIDDIKLTSEQEAEYLSMELGMNRIDFSQRSIVENYHKALKTYNEEMVTNRTALTAKIQESE